MTKKTSQQKGKSFKLPVQKLSGKSLITKAASFYSLHGIKPTSLVLQFEIDLNSIARDKYYLIGYLKSGKGKNTKFSKKITIPQSKEPETKLSLPGDVLSFGNIEISYKKLVKALEKKTSLTFTPNLYPNPHVAYDINGVSFNPSPPAAPDF